MTQNLQTQNTKLVGLLELTDHLQNGWAIIGIKFEVQLTNTKQPQLPQTRPTATTNQPAQNMANGTLKDHVTVALGNLFDLKIHISDDGRIVKRDYVKNDTDTWKKIGDALKPLGFKWVSAGKDSRWEKGGI